MKNIPENITRKHMLRVVHEIDIGVRDVEGSRDSDLYCLVHEGGHHDHYY